MAFMTDKVNERRLSKECLIYAKQDKPAPSKELEFILTYLQEQRVVTKI